MSLLIFTAALTTGAVFAGATAIIQAAGYLRRRKQNQVTGDGETRVNILMAASWPVRIAAALIAIIMLPLIIPATIVIAVAITCRVLTAETLEAIRRRKQRREHGQAEPWQPGDHDTCELSEGERLWWEYFTRRYPSLGKEAQR